MNFAATKEEEKEIKTRAEEVLSRVIYYATLACEEITEVKNYKADDFCYGELHAYVEVLEIISRWEAAEQNGLFADTLKRFEL